MSEQQTITLPPEVKMGYFQPVAYFDKHMDCIRVITHDRSVTEHRINEFYTLHEANAREQFDPQYVGFTIKGVRYLFNEVGIELDRVYKLAEIIDKLVKYKPGSTMSVTLDLLFTNFKNNGDLRVNLAA